MRLESSLLARLALLLHHIVLRQDVARLGRTTVERLLVQAVRALLVGRGGGVALDDVVVLDGAEVEQRLLLDRAVLLLLAIVIYERFTTKR